MATPLTTPLETFTAGHPTAVDVAEIERQLRHLWQLAADSAHQRITRACLFNLVAYTETEPRRDHLTGILNRVTSRYPCRAIVLLAEPDRATDHLTASLTAHCHLAGGGKQVCCEQISIHATGPSLNRLPGSVLPLLESDLPVILWWDGNFLHRRQLFSRLRAVADRILFDTSAWPPPVPLPQLAETVTDTMSDLSWTRLTIWQQLLAEAFDEPHCAAAAARFNRLEIIHGPGPGAPLRAALLAGWLTTQLAWPPHDPGHQIQTIPRHDPDTTSVGLLSVRLTGPACEILVAKNFGEATASVTVNVPNACGLPRKRALRPTDDAALLCRELDQPATTPAHYRLALQRAATLSPPGNS